MSKNVTDFIILISELLKTKYFLIVQPHHTIFCPHLDQPNHCITK
jgi:hypothetical protein